MGLQREQTLETLHTAATEIQRQESVETACERTVAAAEEVLDLDMCCLLIYDDGWLVPVAMSSNAPADGARPMKPDQGLAGKTYRTKEPTIVDEIRPDDDTDPAKEFYRSGISVPVGDVGVFQAVSCEPAAFDESDVEYTELLVAHTARTVDRIHYERELEERRTEVQRQNERLEEFVDAVSHDLRNPLNVADGHLELARSECDSDHLETVARAHDRMSDRIEDLLTLAREGDPVDEWEAVDLGTLAEECWRYVSTTDATLVIDTERTVRADPNRLSRLFENLFQNAVDHAGDDVTITVGDLPDDAGFYVADDGAGIPADRREDVFRRGYSTREAGTGFGLAIVREIVDAHGWQITVTDSESGGTRFEVTDVEFV